MTRRTKLLGIAVLVLAVGTMMASQLSSASHVRPKGATPLRVSLVPSYKQCVAPGNRQHGAPLVFPSCAPPVLQSPFLTTGTPESNGAGANGIAFALLRVKATSPEDVLINSQGTDIRCQPGTAATVCSSPNAVDGPDYSGELEGNAMIRITDHLNGPGQDEPATVIDIPFPVPGTCVSTPANNLAGGTCSAATSANGTVPGSVKDGQRGIVGIQQLQVFDGGADGLIASPDNELYAVQGLFIP
jgi:hypothetical protein